MMEDEMLDNITDSMDMSLSKRWEIVKDREAWHAAIHEITKSRHRANEQFLKNVRDNTSDFLGSERVLISSLS